MAKAKGKTCGCGTPKLKVGVISPCYAPKTILPLPGGEKKRGLFVERILLPRQQKQNRRRLYSPADLNLLTTARYGL